MADDAMIALAKARSQLRTVGAPCMLCDHGHLVDNPAQFGSLRCSHCNVWFYPDTYSPERARRGY